MELSSKPSDLRSIVSDVSFSAVVAGIIAIIVGYAGPTILVFQVAQSAGLTDEQVTSWLWAYSIASGVTTIFASIVTRQPIIMAWSTPGIAFLVLGLRGVPFDEAIGAFIVSNVLILFVGLTGLFNKVIEKIPMSVAAALNAGILLPFALNAIGSVQTAPLIALPMILTFFVVRIFSPRWSVASVFLIGIILCFSQGEVNSSDLALKIAVPILTEPTFTISSIINIAIPLTILALTGQYLPGLTVMRSFGYKIKNNFVVNVASIASIIVAPFCCHNINPSSMIAGIVAGPEAHEDPDKRYWAAITAGVVYIIFGTLAASFVLLFAALPSEAVYVLAGVSLLSAIAISLKTSFDSAKHDFVIPTVVFCVAISDVTILSIGSAFWAIVVGFALSLFSKDKI
ncbi:benzoate/H(+) symporter BenE family transporter [Marinobacter sp. F3R11]|uniref:benzoate/H(+) symporter BenE family transporter n=1 Tax=Marinobacter sp. F3R11 TaxID=2267231 RepID=UPI000DEACDE9|nr:benzoate/H(+) symporter BenE family transporter [Marinobacter sp. F3R11]RBW52412.1 benzoate transporter [Marinobacter sp. F3R11]